METKVEKSKVSITGKAYNDLLTPRALQFLSALHENFNNKRLGLLSDREAQQERFDNGELPAFPPETEYVRDGKWTAAKLPADLIDRRVEITGPVDRKMVINALNSGANVFMADFEDSCSPTWANLMEGQQNLKDAVDKTISLEQNGKSYTLNDKTATLLVRPRGLHLEEKHLQVDGENMSASLVDFGLYFYHNTQTLSLHDTGPYFYLPKLEHYKEARWWNEVFVFAQQYLTISRGTIKATVLIETITASFQLDEIIYELKDHIAGLNCGRWDYIFSYIKKLKNHPGFMVPDRDQVTMLSPFMAAYSLRVIQRCHKRNIHAIGGMAAQIPVKNDDEANKAAFAKVVADKEREAKNGHDGTWVAHPALVPLAKAVFDENMLTRNHIHIKRNDVNITEAQLLQMPQGTITETGVRKNINVGILYVESWITGTGAAALYNLMEDAATAEISRMQLWQWIKAGVTLDSGTQLSPELYEVWVADELDNIKEYIGAARFDNGRFDEAVQLFNNMVLAEVAADFLTLEAYRYID
jgi:malate synthase